MVLKLREAQEDWASFCEKHKTIMDVIFIMVFAGAYAYNYFITTMIPYICSDRIMDLAFSISRFTTSCGLILAALAILATRNRLQMLLEGFLLIFLVIYYIKGFYHPVFIIFVFAIAATNRSAKGIVFTTFLVGLVMLITCFTLDFRGIIPKADVFYQGKNTLGIVYNTDAGAHVLFLILAYCYLKPHIHKDASTPKKILMMLLNLLVIGAGLWVAFYTGSQNNMVLLGVLFIGTLFYDHMDVLGVGRGRVYAFLHAVLGVPFAALLSLLSYLFSTTLNWEELPFEAFLSRFTDTSVIRNQISFGKDTLARFSYITTFGTHVEERGPWGIIPAGQSTYFINSSFLRIPLLYGFGINLMFLGMMTWYQIRNIIRRRYYDVFLVCIALASGLMEHHLLDFSYMFFIFLTFTREESVSRTGEEKEEGEEEEEEKEEEEGEVSSFPQEESVSDFAQEELVSD